MDGELPPMPATPEQECYSSEKFLEEKFILSPLAEPLGQNIKPDGPARRSRCGA
jgi:hypothetical protein